MDDEAISDPLIYIGTGLLLFARNDSPLSLFSTPIRLPFNEVELKLHPYIFSSFSTCSGIFGFSSFLAIGIFIPFSLAFLVASS